MRTRCAWRPARPRGRQRAPGGGTAPRKKALRACAPAAHGVQRGRVVVGGHQAVVQHPERKPSGHAHPLRMASSAAARSSAGTRRWYSTQKESPQGLRTRCAWRPVRPRGRRRAPGGDTAAAPGPRPTARPRPRRPPPCWPRRRACARARAPPLGRRSPLPAKSWQPHVSREALAMQRYITRALQWVCFREYCPNTFIANLQKAQFDTLATPTPQAPT